MSSDADYEVVARTAPRERERVPFMIVGFVLAFFGVAASGEPKHFRDSGERWQEHGRGWDSGD